MLVAMKMAYKLTQQKPRFSIITIQFNSIIIRKIYLGKLTNQAPTSTNKQKNVISIESIWTKFLDKQKVIMSDEKDVASVRANSRAIRM